MLVGIQDEILRLHSMGLLKQLLVDKTTRTNIIWATDAYQEQGAEYQRDKEIKESLITGQNSDVIKTKAFFNSDEQSTECISFSSKNKWQHYVDARRLEITCGEAPYLVNRYDVSTGESILLENREGILDRKLQAVNENVYDEKEWMRWVIRAFQSTYGYEFQGDNVLIARVNLLMTFEEYLYARWKRKPSATEYREIVKIIAWNIWQMDGLSGTIPYCRAEEEFHQFSLFEWIENEEYQEKVNKQPHCRIYDWRRGNSLEYTNVNKEGRNMRFNFVIGNPPYQDETIGDNKGFAPPIYHKFLDEAYKVSDAVEMIHPARFLFNAGSTPKTWNAKMLNDAHFKVLHYESDASKIFPNTDIKGGVVITYHDIGQDFGAIKIFTPYEELNSIMKKAAPKSENDSLMSIIYLQNRFNLDALYRDYPEYQSVIGSDGKDKRFRNNIFDKIPIFVLNRMAETDIKVIGVSKNKRIWMYISSKYVEHRHENLKKWKALVARVNGSGSFGEVLSSPIVAAPNEGYTQTFIGIGGFNLKWEAENVLKYLKSKFCRTMLGILKITQDNNRETWRMVPLQNFTSTSDINWSKSIADIDRQLYVKYGLDDKEVVFIESHVKEME